MNDRKDTSTADPAATPSSQKKSALQDASRYEKFATTQAAGDGIEGDALDKKKTEDEKLGSQMADRK